MAKKAAKTMPKGTDETAAKATSKSSTKTTARASAKADALRSRARSSSTTKPAPRSRSRKTSQKQNESPDASSPDHAAQSRARSRSRPRPSPIPLPVTPIHPNFDPTDTFPGARQSLPQVPRRGPVFPSWTPSCSSIGDCDSDYDPTADSDFDWAAVPRRSEVYVRRPYRDDELAELNSEGELKGAVAGSMGETKRREWKRRVGWENTDDDDDDGEELLEARGRTYRSRKSTATAPQRPATPGRSRDRYRRFTPAQSQHRAPDTLYTPWTRQHARGLQQLIEAGRGRDARGAALQVQDREGAQRRRRADCCMVLVLLIGLVAILCEFGKVLGGILRRWSELPDDGLAV